MRARHGFTVVLLALPALAGCGLGASQGPPGAGGRVEVVAAENAWGSIAAQLGGHHVHVTSLIANPVTDPHSYEATPADARTVARAGYFILNGAGYDPWAPKLVAANPVAGRRVLDVSAVVGLKEGDNPHAWYSPAYVDRVVDRVTADLKALDPADAADLDRLNASYRTESLRDYHATIAAIHQRYAGTPVGATENVVAYLADAAGLSLVTPVGYMKAVSEAADPSVADRAEVQQQVTSRQVRVLMFNPQNTTPDVNALVDVARARGVPVVSMTETPSPAGATFQDWQTAQLRALLAALGG